MHREARSWILERASSSVRYRVGFESLPLEEYLIQLHKIGRHGSVDPTDGVASGWSGGDHVLDVNFDLEKNIINDALHLAIRVDTDKIPGPRLKAYTKMETDALAQLNPSGKPTKAQRLEAKEAAMIRAEAEAADGRFRKMAFYPVLWDGQSNTLYSGATSASVNDRLQTLFRETFDLTLVPVTPQPRLYQARGQERGRGPGTGPLRRRRRPPRLLDRQRRTNAILGNSTSSGSGTPCRLTATW